MARVLIVEDDVDLADLESELLADAGATCIVTHSLAEVEAAADEALRCDVAIIDVNLGSGEPSGVDVHAWLRRRGFRGSVTFLTGHALHHPLVQAAVRTPGTTVLAKPVEPRVLVALAA